MSEALSFSLMTILEYFGVTADDLDKLSRTDYRNRDLVLNNLYRYSLIYATEAVMMQRQLATEADSVSEAPLPPPPQTLVKTKQLLQHLCFHVDMSGFPPISLMEELLHYHSFTLERLASLIQVPLPLLTKLRHSPLWNHSSAAVNTHLPILIAQVREIRRLFTGRTKGVGARTLNDDQRSRYLGLITTILQASTLAELEQAVAQAS